MATCYYTSITKTVTSGTAIITIIIMANTSTYYQVATQKAGTRNHYTNELVWKIRQTRHNN